MTRAMTGVLSILLAGPVLADVWGHLEAGRYAVGFETRHVTDETRPLNDWDEAESLSLQISIWYPAAREGDVVLSVGDYVALTAAEFASDGTVVSDDRRAAALGTIGDFPLEEVPQEALAEALSLEGRAATGAPPAQGRFPLLVVIPGNHDPAWRHFVLGEYLASHGYVVAAFPSAGRRVRDTINMSFGYGPFRQQLLDTAFVTDYLRGEHPLVDAGRFMLFGFSIGGNTGGYSLLRDPDVNGFICLDCGIGSTWGTPFLNDMIDATFPAAVQRPLAFLHISEGGERNDDSFIDRFGNAYAYHAIVEGAKHFTFTSLGAIAAEIPGIEHERWLSSGRFARETHDQSLRWARLVMDAHLRDSREAAEALEKSDPATRVHLHRIATP